MNKRIRFISIIIIGIILLSIFSYISYKLYNNYLITKFITEQKELQINYNKEDIALIEEDIKDIKEIKNDNLIELIAGCESDRDVKNKNIEDLMKIKDNKNILNELIKQNENSIIVYDDLYKGNILIFNRREKIFKSIIKRFEYNIQTWDNYLKNKHYIYYDMSEVDRFLINEYKDTNEYISDSIMLERERTLKRFKANSKKIIQLQEQSKNINNIISKSSADIRILFEKYLSTINIIISKLEEINSLDEKDLDVQKEVLKTVEEYKNKLFEVREFLEKKMYK
ncbi:hypothetical protein [Candidatus Ruminimicrobiellum ovillum]|uniref:hypothetical protein n=1 Tax=Candidatus Ruminimicrobiellum ovillum TaxID=1947927 RepID=UPI00355952BF